MVILLMSVYYAIYHAKYRSTGGPGSLGGPGGCGASMTNKPIPAMIDTIVRDGINVVLSVLDNVAPVNNAMVKTRVDGQLMYLAFTKGQTVEASDLLAEIDLRTYQA